MAFITSMNIVDTGFLTVKNRTAQLARAQRANEGNEIVLKAVKITFNGSSNLDYETNPGNDGEVQAELISVNADKVTLEVYLNRKSTANNPGVWNTSDLQNIPALIKLAKTKGFKAIYYPVAFNSANLQIRKQDEQLLFYMGRRDLSSVTPGDIAINLASSNTQEITGNLSNVRYVAVRFENWDIMQDVKGRMILKLEGVVTV